MNGGLYPARKSCKGQTASFFYATGTGGQGEMTF